MRNAVEDRARYRRNLTQAEWPLTRKIGSTKRRFYIVFVSRDEDGNLHKVPVPLHYAYVFVAAAAVGLFTITGLAGSYSRMLIKTSRFNQLRHDQESLRKDYAQLEQQAHAKDVQAASLGALATEVSALYGLTTSKLAAPMGRLVMGSGASGGKAIAKAGRSAGSASGALAEAPVKDTTENLSDAGYYKSLDTFNELRFSAMSGMTARAIAGSLSTERGLGVIRGFDSGPTDGDMGADMPSLWPVMGPITSSFGEREDPVLGNGESEFHTGVDISASMGTPIRATADGVVKSAGMVNGYGREIVVDHGHGIETCYGHMSAFAVMGGQTVVRGQVIGYVGHSGRTTGNHVHYEVRVRNTPVNPHKYLRTTLAELGEEGVKAGE